MLKFLRLTVLTCLLMIAACEQDRFAEGWSKGGALHDATLRDWAFATDANRLATAADFAAEHRLGKDEDIHRVSSALFEKCLTEKSHIAPFDYIMVKSHLDSCLEYVGRKAVLIAKEF